MSPRMRLRTLAFVVAVLPGLLAGCSGGGTGHDTAPSPAGSASASPTPTPGGDHPVTATPPSAPMDDLEQAVAARLGHQVAHEGLDLEYVACPRWQGKAPRRITCHAYVDGVPTTVRVRLDQLAGGAVSFKARLAHGLIATSELERQLRADGFTEVNCGSTPAYPSVVGSHVVCAVSKNGHREYVRATVTSRSGAVEISAY